MPGDAAGTLDQLRDPFGGRCSPSYRPWSAPPPDSRFLPGLPTFCAVPFTCFVLTMASLFGTLVVERRKMIKFGVHCLEAVHLIEPADNDMGGVVAIDFNAVAPPSAFWAGSSGRATPGEDVENKIAAALGAIANRVGNQRHRLDRRVHGKFGTAVLAKGVHPRVIPDVCAITTKPPPLDIVDSWRAALLEHKYQLML